MSQAWKVGVPFVNTLQDVTEQSVLLFLAALIDQASRTSELLTGLSCKQSTLPADSEISATSIRQALRLQLLSCDIVKGALAALPICSHRGLDRWGADRRFVFRRV